MRSNGVLRGWRRSALDCALLALLLTVGPAALAQAAPSFEAHGSVEQVFATGLGSGQQATLFDSRGRKVATEPADGLGGVLFRKVKPGGGYRVGLASGGSKSGPLQVLSTQSAPLSTDIYNQSIPARGYGYLTTRDGTQLAIDVHPAQDVANVAPGLPALPTVPTAPTPTLIEYSGYGYADPAGPQSGLALIANLMGFTVVDVNMRGTGCSGGAYDFFEPLQSLDGYDVIETIARQPWVANHQVGMMGISYGGISQLFTAATQPPSLAAISPLSVLDSTQTTLYPGGLLNTGFAVPWAEERVHDAKAATATEGQAWAYKRIQEGDATCAGNQVLHGEAVNLLDSIKANSHYRPKVADPLSPITFVNKIDVPTFMACQWTDEQTGGHCPDLAEHFSATTKKWFTFTNGTHIDSLDPATFNRWYDFLELYVAREAPILHAATIQAGAPLIYQEAMGITGVTLPPDPVQLQPTYAGALAAFESQPSIRVLFDNGAGSTPGKPVPGFEGSFAEFPIPGTQAHAWYLSTKGALRDKPPGRSPHADGFTWNASALPKTDFSGDTSAGAGGLWTATPSYEWAQSPAGSAASYLTAPLAENTTVIGAGAVRVWVRSSVPNVDLQATISEIRPDGLETFVQNGWVRGNERKLDSKKSTPLAPVLSLRKSDLSPLPRGRFVKVTIPLYYEGHVYRAGSRIRVTIAAPNGTQPVWSFARTQPKGTAKIAIGHSRKMPSKLILPVVPGVGVPTGLPPCPGLRGEPCRGYQPYANRVAKP
ncbi:MAG: CocE/NonD family hydrolase [Solirubrobacterales bacterium]|nr:CocE/NonD family hydrolase [Solirubrobacterales bacterium]